MLRQTGKRALRKLFQGGQRIGVDILPRHFYSELPDIAALKKSDAWRTPRSMDRVVGAGIDIQCANLSSCFTDKVKSNIGLGHVYIQACAANGAVGYGPIEADILYAFVATHSPPRVLQVGAGVTTAILLHAKREFDLDMEIICVDPFPTDYLVGASKRGEIELLRLPAQELTSKELADVGEGGLLFVDSTHTVKPGSEVNLLILDVLSDLPANSWAHFHDITWPYDYSPALLDDSLFFWNESALLLARICGDPRIELYFSASMLHDQRPDVIRSHIAQYEPRPMSRGIQTGSGHFPSATILRLRPGI